MEIIETRAQNLCLRYKSQLLSHACEFRRRRRRVSIQNIISYSRMILSSRTISIHSDEASFSFP
jgi:hypothetical protein